VEGGGDGVPVSAGDPAEMDFEEAERRGMRLVASAGIRDNFLGLYERRFAKSEFSAVQKATLECVAASRCISQWVLTKYMIVTPSISSSLISLGVGYL
jgi:general transcription factor 3C polypeptide 1